MKKIFKIIFYLLPSLSLVVISVSCEKDEDLVYLPIVSTETVSSITDTSALCVGHVESDGGSRITGRGAIWSLDESPESRFLSNDSSGLGNFTSQLTGLVPNTKYNVQAYATNSAGTAFGEKISFNTFPRFLTLGTKKATSNTITLVGFVLTTKFPQQTSISFEYGTSSAYGEIFNLLHPSAYQLDVGYFYEAHLKGLLPNTKYHFRIKAVRSHGEIYGKDLTFQTLNDLSVNDIEGNLYNTVEIGAQIWMTENLHVTNYNDGTSIPFVSDDSDWSNLTTPAYCWYEDYEEYRHFRGALYNWYTVNTEKLCPTGWHVPTKDEWELLLSTVGGRQVAGNNLKWLLPFYRGSEGDGTNSFSFSAMMGGMRDKEGSYLHGLYFQGTSGINEYGYWYTSSVDENGNPLILCIPSLYSYATLISVESKLSGYSVRCIKD
jgi:uncharacterized protein (TIGR02145 family)